jgi:hypothetical protein
MQIDLVYFEGCPHVAPARQRIEDALRSLALPARWSEWDTGDASTPPSLRGYSSPTVLVNGIDVEHKATTSGAGCAVGGGPSVDELRAALTAASR